MTIDLDDPIAVLLAVDLLFEVPSTRDRDLEDAASVVQANRAALDRSQLDEEGRLLAAEIGDHDVAGRLARVLTG